MPVSVTWRNRLKTVMLFMVWTTKGLYLEALGPAMIDLKLIYNTNYESVTRAVSGRGIGGFTGAILGAILVEKFESHLDLFVAMCTTSAGLCVALVASVSSIDHVWLLYVLIGTTSCVVNMAATRMALQIWKEKSSTILQLLHMGYGVGGLIGPLICAPFLAVTQNVEGKNHESHFTVVRESRANVAFFLIGIFTLIVAVPFYVFQVTKNKQHDSTTIEAAKQTVVKKRSFLDYINPSSYANNNFWLGASVFTLMSVYFFNLVGGEKAYVSFVRTIAVDVFKLGKNEASYLNSSFWISLTVGRFIGSFVAHFVHVRTLILAQVLLHLGSVTFIYMYALTDAHMFWSLTLVEGFIVAPLYSLGVAYANTQISMSGFCLMIVALMGSVGDLAYVWTAGRLYDVYSAQGVVVLTNIAGWSVTAIVMMYRFLALPYIERYK